MSLNPSPEVYKFGGASLKNAAGFRHVAGILSHASNQKLLIVVSALGKTTNILEKIAQAYFEKNSEQTHTLFDELQSRHNEIIADLFPDTYHRIFDDISNLYMEIEWVIEEEPHPDFDFVYDQIVSVGELLSSKILSEYLIHLGILNTWVDSRDYIHTDNTYREGKVKWEQTCRNIEARLPSLLEKNMVLTQGFLGSTSENYSITLGREGSDYSASIFANCLNAEALTVWKDVPGIMNADPGIFPEATILPEISYAEATELAYYGATVIHPKTLRPLQNKKIPLYVKSFLEPSQSGTMVSEKEAIPTAPSYILKKNQVLITLQTHDFSFILEDHLSSIFLTFAENRIKINMMENSALRFSAVVDSPKLGQSFDALFKNLSASYFMKYNEDLNLLTVRHYGMDPSSLTDILEGHQILLESKTRQNLQVVYK